MIWANVGVEDVKRTEAFYRALGLSVNGQPSEDLVSFFFGDTDFVIHFFRKDKLKESLEGGLSDLSKGNEVMFSLSVQTRSAYDDWTERIRTAGGNILFDSNTDRKEFYDENGFYVVFSQTLTGTSSIFCTTKTNRRPAPYGTGLLQDALLSCNG